MFEDVLGLFRGVIRRTHSPAAGALAAALTLLVLQPRLAAAPPDATLVRLLPPNAAAAGNIDLAGLRSSTVFQNFMPMMGPGSQPSGEEAAEPSESDARKAKAMAVFQTLESMVSGSYYANPDDTSEREDLFVLKGGFGGAEMDEFLAGAPAMRSEHRGVTIHNLPRDLDAETADADQGDEPAEPKPPISLAVLSDTVAVAGTERLVREAIDRNLDGATAANEGLLALGDPVAGSYHLWHIIDAAPLKALAPDPGEGSEDGPAGMAAGMMTGFFDDMQQLRIALQLDEGLGLRLEGLFASEERAKLASQAFGGLLAIAQLGGPAGQGGESPVPPEALELLKAVEIVSAERAAGLAIKVTGEQIGNLMFAFMSGAADGAGGEIEPAPEQ